MRCAAPRMTCCTRRSARLVQRATTADIAPASPPPRPLPRQVLSGGIAALPAVQVLNAATAASVLYPSSIPRLLTAPRSPSPATASCWSVSCIALHATSSRSLGIPRSQRRLRTSFRISTRALFAHEQPHAERQRTEEAHRIIGLVEPAAPGLSGDHALYDGQGGRSRPGPVTKEKHSVCAVQ